MEKTSWKTLVDWKRISSSSMIETEKTLTISKITKEDIIADNGRKANVIMCYFKDYELPMCLNKTNCRTIEKLYGTDKIQDWVGKQVTIFVKDGIKLGNEVVRGLRIKDFIPAAPKQFICADCSKPITAASGMTAEAIAEYTFKNYGVKVCAECGKKRKESK